MIAARLVAISVAVLACVGLWYGWENLGLLRGTMFQDLRYVVFAAAAFLLLSIAEWLAGRLSGLFGGGA